MPLIGMSPAFVRAVTARRKDVSDRTRRSGTRETRTVRAAVKRESNVALQRDRREEVVVRALVDRNERSRLLDRKNEVRLQSSDRQRSCREHNGGEMYSPGCQSTSAS